MRKSFRKPGKEGERKSQGQHGLPGRDHQPVPGKPGPSAGSFWGLTPAPFSGLKAGYSRWGKPGSTGNLPPPNPVCSPRLGVNQGKPPPAPVPASLNGPGSRGPPGIQGVTNFRRGQIRKLPASKVFFWGLIKLRVPAQRWGYAGARAHPKASLVVCNRRLPPAEKGLLCRTQSFQETPTLFPALGDASAAHPSARLSYLWQRECTLSYNPGAAVPRVLPRHTGLGRGRAVLLDHAHVKAGERQSPPSGWGGSETSPREPGSRPPPLSPSKSLGQTCVWSRKHYLAFGF